MEVFGIYYLITFLYCMIMSARKWNRDVRAGGLGVTPAMDTMAIIMMCWALAPVDIFLTWMRVYKEAEEVRRRIDKENNIF
jgi:erythromycin esterase-like protein